MSEAAAEQVADDYWEFHRTTAQLWNIDRGDVDQIEHWEDLSPGGMAQRVARLEDFAERADESGRADLDDRARSLMAAVAFSARANASILPYLRDVSLVAGPFNMAAFLTILVPGYGLTSRAHGQGYITKLRSAPLFVDGWIAGLIEGVAMGRRATARGIMSAIAELDAILDSDPATSWRSPATARDGACTPNDSQTGCRCTAARSSSSACSRSTRFELLVWSSTPVSTRWVGPATRRSNS